MIHVILGIRAPAKPIGGRNATVASDHPRQGFAEIGYSFAHVPTGFAPVHAAGTLAHGPSTLMLNRTCLGQVRP
jgi:hypothetical protein